MKKALNQWCFPEGTSLETIFHLSEKYGYDGVELNLYNSGETGITLESDTKDVQSIRKQAASYGLELKSLSSGLYWGASLTDSDDSVREKAKSILKKQLEVAHDLEMDAILVVPGLVNEHVTYHDAFSRSFQSIEPFVSLAEDYGVKIGIENVWNKFLLSPLEMMAFIDSFNTPFVASYFDVGNVLQFGYPEHWIENLNHRIVKVHIKDFSNSVGNIHGFVPLLSGDVDWKNVFHALKTIGYEDYVTAELSPYAFNPEVLVANTANAINQIFDMGGLT